MRKSILTVTAVMAIAVATAAPASAADTTTTFSVTGGGLSITAPTSTDLGSGAPGATISAALGAVTVTDARAALDAKWTASVSSSGFGSDVTGASAVPNNAVTYAPGIAATTGVATVVPGAGGSMGAAQTAQQATVATGNNTAVWSPTLTVTVPAAAVAAKYSGVVTHSAA